MRFTTGNIAHVRIRPEYLKKFKNLSEEEYRELLEINPDVSLLKGTQLECTLDEDRVYIFRGKLFCKNVTLHDFSIRVSCNNITLDNCHLYFLEGQSLDNCTCNNCIIHLDAVIQANGTTFNDCELFSTTRFGKFDRCTFNNCKFDKVLYDALDESDTFRIYLDQCKINNCTKV